MQLAFHALLEDQVLQSYRSFPLRRRFNIGNFNPRAESRRKSHSGNAVALVERLAVDCLERESRGAHGSINVPLVALFGFQLV